MLLHNILEIGIKKDGKRLPHSNAKRVGVRLPLSLGISGECIVLINVPRRSIEPALTGRELENTVLNMNPLTCSKYSSVMVGIAKFVGKLHQWGIGELDTRMLQSLTIVCRCLREAHIPIPTSSVHVGRAMPGSLTIMSLGNYLCLG